MPARISRSSVTTKDKPKNARQKNKKRSLDAYAQAQKLVPEERIAQHRLGEDIDDGPRQKRRKRDDDDDDEDDDEEELPQRKRLAGRSGNDDDGVEYGSDLEGNELTLGGFAEDDEGSDLDSDAAFGDSDEERFQGFTFRGSSSGKAKLKKRKPVAGSSSRGRNIDLKEEESSGEDEWDSQDEEGLGFGDDAVDLAAMLDDDDDEIMGAKDNTSKDVGEETPSDEDEEDDRDEESSSESDENDEELNEESLARMKDRLEALDTVLGQTSTLQPSATVTLDDFLEDTNLAPETVAIKGKKLAKPTALAAPLPKRQQDKLDRAVATQKAKEQLDRWRDTVIRNRRAEFLTFPLQNPSDQSGTLGRENFLPADQQAPQNDLEQSIQRIMEESGLATKPGQENENDVGNEEAALLRAEELAEKKLPVEEVMRRRDELRKARELLFREEIKAKRLAKIKSKSFRRVHRRERERKAEQERELLEGMGVDPMDEGDHEREDRQRAEARMSTKHKDSKWAKSLKQTNRTAWDDDARDSVLDQARRNEELKKRIAGKDVSDNDDDSPSDDESDDEGQTVLERLDKFEASSPANRSRLANLPFMRAADERRRKATDQDVERLRKELAVADGDEEESEAEEENIGRAVFGPQYKERNKNTPKKNKLEFEVSEGSDDEEQGEDDPEATVVTDNTKSSERKPQSKSILKRSTSASVPFANGWLKGAEGKENTTKSPVSGWLKAPKASMTKKNQIQVDVDMDLIPRKEASPAKKLARVNEPKPTSNENAGNTDGWTVVTYNDESESDAQNDPSNPVLTAQEQKQSLMQRAFAGDDVQTTFEAEKADLAASEDEKEVSTHLPGWGSWTGEGLSKSIKKSNARAKHNPLFKTKVDGVRQADRKDAKLKNVIISEKQDRKGKKYLASTLPHEFENKEQYERSRRLPMGPEWTTKEVHQRMTRPRVVIKKGVNVQALERPVV